MLIIPVNKTCQSVGKQSTIKIKIEKESTIKITSIVKPHLQSGN